MIAERFFSDVMHSNGNPMVNVLLSFPSYATHTEWPSLFVKAQNALPIGLIRSIVVEA